MLCSRVLAFSALLAAIVQSAPTLPAKDPDRKGAMVFEVGASTPTCEFVTGSSGGSWKVVLTGIGSEAQCASEAFKKDSTIQGVLYNSDYGGTGTCWGGTDMQLPATDPGSAYRTCLFSYLVGCTNGFASRHPTVDFECVSCNSGYDLVGKKCQPYGGQCDNGSLRPISQRTGDNQCGSCKVGYTLAGTTCVAA